MLKNAAPPVCACYMPVTCCVRFVQCTEFRFCSAINLHQTGDVIASRRSPHHFPKLQSWLAGAGDQLHAHPALGHGEQQKDHLTSANDKEEGEKGKNYGSLRTFGVLPEAECQIWVGWERPTTTIFCPTNSGQIKHTLVGTSRQLPFFMRKNMPF